MTPTSTRIREGTSFLARHVVMLRRLEMAGVIGRGIPVGWIGNIVVTIADGIDELLDDDSTVQND